AIIKIAINRHFPLLNLKFLGLGMTGFSQGMVGGGRIAAARLFFLLRPQLKQQAVIPRVAAVGCETRNHFL
ncbi:MAG: hypothetical protein JXR58_14050, partial [Bacteroidales bacterium]|nr:hypothetical protein [Bacteroidales bacterium]